MTEFNSAREAAEEDVKRNSDDVIQFFDGKFQKTKSSTTIFFSSFSFSWLL